MKKMVHIVGNLAPGGMGSFLMNLYQNIDRDKVQFDFIVMGIKENNYHARAEELGATIYKITGLSQNPVKYFMEIRDIVKKNKYDIVFRHTDVATVAIDLVAARMGGAKRRIPHSHSTDSKHMLAHKLLRPVLVANATECFACSRPAAEWMYGKHPFKLVRNGIDLKRYAFDFTRRSQKRMELGLSQDAFVIGHVGNFVYAKNHVFLLDVFAKVAERVPQAKLLLAGDGQLRGEIEEKIQTLGLESKVELLGIRNDVADLLQAMDVYLFPSVYEGLPVAVVEAQAAGLPCLISDTIAPEIKLTDHIQALSLQAPIDEWVEHILEMAKGSRADSTEILREAGYDIMQTVRFYESL